MSWDGRTLVDVGQRSPGDGAPVRLICVDGGGPNVELETGEIRIGRHAENDLVLESDRVSRKHARVFRREDRFLVEDLGSSNGTFVNGRKLVANRAESIRHQDVLRMGDYRYLLFDVKDMASKMPSLSIDAAAVEAEVDRLLQEFRTGKRGDES